MTTTGTLRELKTDRIARFQISGSFSGNSANPFGLNDTLLHQRILSECRKAPRTPAQLAERVSADEPYIVDALAHLTQMEIVGEVGTDEFIGAFYFPTFEDDELSLRHCAPYVESVIETLKEHLSGIQETLAGCSFARTGFGWKEMHWIVLHEWLQQPPGARGTTGMTDAEILRSLGPLRPDGGRWFLLGHDLKSPLSEAAGSRSFREYPNLGRHYRVDWTGAGTLMTEDEFAIVPVLAVGPKREHEVLSELSGDKVRGTLARCVESGHVTSKHGEFTLAFPVVWPEDEEKITRALQPVTARMAVARSEWSKRLLDVAREQGFDWLVENHPDSVQKGLEGLLGLGQRLERERILMPPPDSGNPSWGMWAKTWQEAAGV